jgi:hypothetical protein
VSIIFTVDHALNIQQLGGQIVREWDRKRAVLSSLLPLTPDATSMGLQTTSGDTRQVDMLSNGDGTQSQSLWPTDELINRVMAEWPDTSPEAHLNPALGKVLRSTVFSLIFKSDTLYLMIGVVDNSLTDDYSKYFPCS